MEEGVVHVCCPYCLKSSNVSFSNSKQSDKPWWNTSNFDRHVQLTHKSFTHFETRADCEYNIFHNITSHCQSVIIILMEKATQHEH